jgi:hypothetical protein
MSDRGGRRRRFASRMHELRERGPAVPDDAQPSTCPHPDWRINWFAGGEPDGAIELRGEPLVVMRMQPVCTECGDPVQVGAP